MENIGSKIQSRRKIMALSQTGLAEGISSQSTISRLENNNLTVSLNEFIEIVKRLNLSLHYLLCNGEELPYKLILEKMDDLRSAEDYSSILEILEMDSGEFWKQTPELEAYQYWHLGLIAYSNGELKTALNLISAAIKMSADNDLMYEAVAEMQMAKGNIYCALGMDSLECYKQAEEYYIKSSGKSFKLSVKILYNLSNNLYHKGEYKKAVKYCKKALGRLQENESTYLICEILNRKFLSLIQLGDQEKAFIKLSESKYLFHTEKHKELFQKLENYSL